MYGAFFNEHNLKRHTMKKIGTVVSVNAEGTATLNNGKRCGKMEWPLFTDREEARRWADEHPPKLPFGGKE